MMQNKELVAVWPLIDDLEGCNAQGFACKLSKGLPGYMEREDAEKAKAEKSVEWIAGNSIDYLHRALMNAEKKTTVVKPEAKRGRGRPKSGEYLRTDMKAQGS